MDSKWVKTYGQVASSSKGECPVCFKIPREKIFQCINGHSICEQCSAKVSECPTCRSPGVKIRNRLAESLLDEVQFKCNWNSRGCNETMLRGQLSAHEDQCGHNPHIIKFCSFISNHVKNCEYKFTPSWLSEPQNCTEFINHIKACQDIICLNNVRIGSCYSSAMDLNYLKSLTLTPSNPAQHYFAPKFYRFLSSSNGKEQLFFRINLLKFDKSGNAALSWAIVKLTLEITPFVIKMTIKADANSKMVSEWGPQSSSILTWIIKPIVFNDFKKMVEVPQNTENGLSFPYSVPISFWSDYYVNDNGTFIETMTIQSRSSTSAAGVWPRYFLGSVSARARTQDLLLSP